MSIEKIVGKLLKFTQKKRRRKTTSLIICIGFGNIARESVLEETDDLMKMLSQVDKQT